MFSWFTCEVNQCWGSAGSACVFGLPDPEPLVRGTNPVPDPSLLLIGLWISYKKKIRNKIFFYILKVTEESSRIRSLIRISQRYGSGDPDPDPHQSGTDPPTLCET
jgi:hypothetical protein